MFAPQRRHLYCWALALASAWTATPAPVRAQAPASGDPLNLSNSNSNPILMVLAPSVQKELNLTEPQKTKVFELARISNQKGRDLTQAMFLSGGSNPQAIMAAGANFRRENEQAIGKILDATQRERLSQIVLQSEGPLAVARPEIAAKLNLNNAQNEAVQTIMLQQQQLMRQLVFSIRQGAAQGQFDPSQMGQVRGQADKIRENTVLQLGKVLDRKQKANFNKMLGAPFDLNSLDSTRSGDPAESKAEEKPAAADKGDDSAAKKDGDTKSSRKKSRFKP